MGKQMPSDRGGADARAQHRRPVLALDGQLVQVLPTPGELARAPGLSLTARDRTLLVAVYEQGFLTLPLIERAFFPSSPGGRRSPCSTAYDRVRRLWLWGYLDRVERPVVRRLGGSRPALYALGARGVPIVESRSADTPDGDPDAGMDEETVPVQRRRLDRLSAAGVDHDLLAAALWANLMAELPRTRVRHWRWTPERVLRARRERVRDRRSDRWLPFLPDAAVELEYPDGTLQVCLVEIDRGTQPLRKIRLKVRAFEEFLDQGLFGKRWRRDEFEVLVLTHSRRRLANLWRVARQEVAQDRWALYQFATFDILEPRRWDAGQSVLTLENTRVDLLYTMAYDDAEDAPDAPNGPGASDAPSAEDGGAEASGRTGAAGDEHRLLEVQP